ncbi:MAG: alpha/beta hydrolase [Verrucomicrobia bacterium]|nr:alpha/beta hydrolase [Verrucomicrobiota bacterium]
MKSQLGLTASVSLLLLCGCATTGDRPVSEPRTASLFFATDRGQTESNNGRTRFGTDRGELAMGTCSVRLAWNLNDLKSDTAMDLSSGFPLGPAVLTELTAVSPDEFQHALEKAFERTSSRELMVLVHGFNVSFEKAAFDAAQFADDLNYWVFE